MKQSRNKGFTLIEIILYVSLVSLFISAAVLFAWDIIYGQVKSDVQQQVSHNIRLASKRMQYEIRNATGINSVSTTSISLASADPLRNPTVFDVSAGRLRIGYGISGLCPVSDPCYLTGNTVSVDSLTFTDLSVGTSSKNITFGITVSANADRTEWQATETYKSSVELRTIQ